MQLSLSEYLIIRTQSERCRLTMGMRENARMEMENGKMQLRTENEIQTTHRTDIDFL